MTLPLSSFGPALNSSDLEDLFSPGVVGDPSNAQNAPDEDDGFEIFDPRGLFSPSHHPREDLVRLRKSQCDLDDNHPLLTSAPVQPLGLTSPSIACSSPIDHLPTLPLSAADSSLEASISLGFGLPRWSIDPLPQSVDLDSDPKHPHRIYHSPDELECRPPDNPTNFDLGADSTPRVLSPFESPISPCSSIPFCPSPSASTSVFKPPLTRGRSPPSRCFSDLHSLPPLTPSRSSFTFSRNDDPAIRTYPHFSSALHRPTPIVTTRLRDSSRSSRLSNQRSPDLSGSVSSLAYSDMDASPAVNFLSAFADATLPSMRTETSPVTTTVPPEGLEEGDQIADHMLGPIIGRGGFSVVREAHHVTNHQRVAVKIVRRSPLTSNSDSILAKRIPPKPISLHASINNRDRSSSLNHTINRHLVNSAHLPLPTSATEDLANALLKQEIHIWSSLRPHPNVVPLLSLHETSTQTLLFMPMCEGGNLLQLLNKVKLDSSFQDELYRIFEVVPVQSITSPSSNEPCGSLCDFVRGLRLDLVQTIFRQVVEGLKYLHTEAGIVHKDIKLENILIQNGRVKISDFGLATYPLSPRPSDAPRPTNGKPSSWNRDLSLPKTFSALPRISEGRVTTIDSRAMSWSQSHRPRSKLPPMLDNSLFSSQPVLEDDDSGFNQIHQSFSSLSVSPTAAGSLAYTPPEQLRSEVPLACPSLDIWALGCVLYGLLDGHLPFEDDFEPRLRLKIMNGHYEPPQALSINPDKMSEVETDNRMMIAKVLKGCLAVDRNARWVIEEIATSAWLAPLSSPNNDMSDDGQSSEDMLDQLSISKQSYPVTSSLPSVWPFDEQSLNQSARLSSPLGSRQESESIGLIQEELLSPTSSPPLHEPCSSPPLTRKDLSNLRKLLATPASYPSSSWNNISISQQFHYCNNSIESPIPSELERPARSKNRGGSERHQHRSRKSLSKVMPGSPMSSNSRSRSRNRN